MDSIPPLSPTLSHHIHSYILVEKEEEKGNTCGVAGRRRGIEIGGKGDPPPPPQGHSFLSSLAKVGILIKTLVREHNPQNRDRPKVTVEEVELNSARLDQLPLCLDFDKTKFTIFEQEEVRRSHL